MWSEFSGGRVPAPGILNEARGFRLLSKDVETEVLELDPIEPSDSARSCLVPSSLALADWTLSPCLS
jgi:hypothetical protein